LRPWRRELITRRFEVAVPENAEGSCELIVRGGGTNSLGQASVEGGWKSIDSLDRMLEEIGAADANNELVVELRHDAMAGKAQSGKNLTLPPEEKEFLSEMKARRIREGTLRVSRLEWMVDGLVKRRINLSGGAVSRSSPRGSGSM
jgi:hypothetical protein